MSSTTSCDLAQWAVLSDPDASNSTKGAVVGATSGASTGSFIGSLIGNSWQSNRDNSIIGAAVGAVAGAALGAAIGNDMDKKAEQRSADASSYNSGETTYYAGGDEVYSQSGARLSAPQRSDGCIYYGQSKTKLDKSAKKALDHVAQRLINDPTACAEVYGYTDNAGTYSQRCRLSVERAQVVKGYLMKKGVPASQIFCKGMADQRPVGDNRTADGRAVNRRVEILITHNVNDDSSDYNYNSSNSFGNKYFKTQPAASTGVGGTTADPDPIDNSNAIE